MWIAKAKDAAFWQKVRASQAYRPFIEELTALWERDCRGDIPACKYSEFIIYNETGSRVEYQKSYFHRRRAMNAAALLSLIYPEEPRYFEKLCDVIWAILDEYVWVLPAHMPSFTENVLTHIDLFAAETGGALSEIDYLFEDRLPALIRSRIRTEVQRRIIDGYMGEKRFGWESNTANWATVCLGSVVTAILYQRPELLDEIRPRIDETVRCYLSGFPEDGMCLEGFGYWHYGFGYFVAMADMLREATGGEINYFAIPKVEKIARYPQRMYLNRTTTVSFSDGGMGGRYHIGLLHYLKHEYPAAVQLLDPALSYTNDECGRWCMHLRAFLWFDETLCAAPCAQNMTDYAAASQWLIHKTPLYGFAAKGGTNAEPHNHNDLGSFILADPSEQILCDPGAGTYSKQYFSAKRYEFFRASSRGHSVPIIAGQYQLPGREHAASTGFEDGVFTVEFSRAYGVEALRQLSRSFALMEDGVTMTDRFVLTEEIPIVERIVSRRPASLTDAGIVTGSAILQTDAEADISVHAEDGLYCIDFALKPGTRAFTLVMKITKS